MHEIWLKCISYWLICGVVHKSNESNETVISKLSTSSCEQRGCLRTANNEQSVNKWERRLPIEINLVIWWAIWSLFAVKMPLPSGRAVLSLMDVENANVFIAVTKCEFICKSQQSSCFSCHYEGIIYRMAVVKLCICAYECILCKLQIYIQSSTCKASSIVEWKWANLASQ